MPHKCEDGVVISELVGHKSACRGGHTCSERLGNVEGKRWWGEALDAVGAVPPHLLVDGSAVCR